MADHGGTRIINSWVTKDEIYFVNKKKAQIELITTHQLYSLWFDPTSV